MRAIQETLPLAAIYSNPIGMTMGSIALGASAAKMFAVIPQGHVGIRERKGRPLLKEEFRGLSEEELEVLPDEIKAKGIYLIESRRVIPHFPVIERVVKVSCLDRTSEPRPFAVHSPDQYKSKFRIDAAFGWHVRWDGDNPYKARYRVNNEQRDSSDKDKDRELEQTVVSICNSGLRSVLNGRSVDALLNLKDEEVTLNTRVTCQERLLNYGVALKDVRIENVEIADATIYAQAIRESRNPAGAVLMAALAQAEREGGRIPLYGVPDPAA